MGDINPFKDSRTLHTEEEAYEMLNGIAERRQDYAETQVSKFVKCMRDSLIFSDAKFEYKYDREDDMFYIEHFHEGELSDDQFNILINNQIKHLDDEGVINYSFSFKRRETIV